MLQITREEFDWLEGCERLAGARQATRGNLEIVEQEVDSHGVSTYTYTWSGRLRFSAMGLSSPLCTPDPQKLLDEVEGHQQEAEFIDLTLDFLLEHSRKCNREEITAQVEDFSQRYNLLRESLATYVKNLQVGWGWLSSPPV